jgi:hypothetical protein
MSADNALAGFPFGAQTRNPFNYSKVEQITRDVSTPWLTLAEITDHINLFDDESQDTYLQSLELATRMAVEDYLGMSIFPVTYRVWYGAESLVASPTSLDLPEVSQNINSGQAGVTIGSVKYWNDSSPSILTTIDPSQYYYDASGNKIIVSSLPTDINSAMTAPIVVEYSTVSNPLSAYPVIKQAGLLLLTHLYNNRANATETKLKDIPFGVTTLLRNYKPLVM